MGEPLFCLHQKGPRCSPHASRAFSEFDFLKLTFLPQIAGFVNAKSTDASIQQVCLDILESMVLSSHSLFLQVKQEITMERLIAHLQV